MTRETIKALPKAELHRHLDGSIRLRTILELARRHGLDLGARSVQELARQATVRAPLRDLQAVLESFATLQKVLCSYEAIKRVAFENVEDAHRDGVRLLELRFAPPFIAAGKDLDNQEIIEAVLDGITLGMESYPVEVGLIGILPRGFDLEVNRKAAEDIIRCSRGGHRNAHRICGFDLADAEDTSDPQDFVPLVEAARRAGLGITIHSGENTTAQAVDTTLDLFRPQRIGHGIRIWGHEGTLQRIREQQVMLELCPTSNWLTRSVPALEEHPLPKLYRSGVEISINSDDPHLFAIDLVHEYEICSRLYGLSRDQFLDINRRTVEHSFLSPEIRAEVLRNYFSSAG
jgi:adenosine deaminase